MLHLLRPFSSTKLHLFLLNIGLADLPDLFYASSESKNLKRKMSILKVM